MVMSKFALKATNFRCSTLYSALKGFELNSSLLTTIAHNGSAT